VKVPSETLLEFRLQTTGQRDGAAVILNLKVHVSMRGSGLSGAGPRCFFVST